VVDFLKRFNQTVAGSRSVVSDYVSTVAPVGDFKRIEGIEVILNSWNNILITPKRSYIFDPEYGSNLYKLVFEPADNITQEKIRQEVITTIQRYDERATIKDVKISYLPNKKGFQVNIDVEYKGDSSHLQVVIDQNLYFRFFESVPQQ
jgi:phage baseplate assembly protein W